LLRRSPQSKLLDRLYGGNSLGLEPKNGQETPPIGDKIDSLER
jgi:hypothetical protein